MDGSQTTPAVRDSSRPQRWSIAQARRREQLRLFVDPLTRAAAARVLPDQRGDAFDALYLRYAPYVAAIGSRLLGRDDELDDLVQDVFKHVLGGLSQLHDPAAFKGWLAQITIRSATRRLRKHNLRRLQTSPPPQRMLRREVYNQLDLLPPPARVIWVLRHVEGEALHTIAQRFGCSLSTMQRRLLEAQAALEDRFLHDFAI